MRLYYFMKIEVNVLNLIITTFNSSTTSSTLYGENEVIVLPPL
jgi:hypothetical protein